MAGDSEKQSKSSAEKRRTAGLKPWKPGQSGNPAGRKKKINTIPDILRAIGEEEGTKDGKYTKLDVVMRRVFEFALDGRSWAVQFIADRTEGKAVEHVKMSGEDDAPVPFTVVMADVARRKKQD